MSEPGKAFDIRYFTKEDLIDAAVIATETDRNRQLDPDLLEENLVEGYKYPVTLAFSHNDEEMRVKIMLGPQEHEVGWLDIPYATYENLPTDTVLPN
tara:strand:- start:760 stop:1050 length:291 start_codon:yes stop_codon:yes gene_type:complete